MNNRFLELAQAARGEITEFMQAAVSIPSLSSQEGAVVECMAEEMKDLGFDEVTVDPMGITDMGALWLE